MFFVLNAIIGAAAGFGCFFLSRLLGLHIEKDYVSLYEQIKDDEQYIESAKAIEHVRVKEPEPRWFFIAFCTVIGTAAGVFAPNFLTFVYVILSLAVVSTFMQTDQMNRIVTFAPCFTLIALKTLSILIPLAYGCPVRFGHELLLSAIGMVVCALLFLSSKLFGKAVGKGDIVLAAATGFALGVKGCLLAMIMMGLLVLAYIVQRSYYLNIPFVERMKEKIPMGMVLGPAYMIVLVLSNATVLLPEISEFMTHLF